MPGSTPTHFPPRERRASGRYTEALLGLTRTIWRPGCTLQHALSLLCETAAHTLQVERCNVWQFEGEPPELRCIHAYNRSTDTHAEGAGLEVLPISGVYVQLLEVVRAIDAADVEADLTGMQEPLRDYLQRHGIVSLLDAPVRSEGRLVGVICHEHVGTQPRLWSPDEYNFAGSMGDCVALAIEIDRRHRAERRLEHLRLHDATTDLPNRDYLVEHLRMRLQDQSSAAIVHAKVYLPYGAAMPAHAPTVEEVMAEAAGRLRDAVGGEVTLVRARADAFALLPQADATEHDVVRLAGRCIDAVRDLSDWRGLVEASAAVGVAFSRDMPGADARVLLRNAELASQRARSQGRNRYELFDPEHHRNLVERLRLEQAIREGIDNDNFVVHYQPEYDLDRERWVAAEALLRWRLPDRTLAADAFIDVAESSGLILALGRRVLARACSDACEWPLIPAPLTLRVNVSAQQFDDPALVDDVAWALSRSGLPPERLCLELTETTLMRDTGVALETMERLQELGVGLAIDDFGTGYSSLAYLRQFPIDALKIDRSFVAGLPADAQDYAIVGAISGLARSLGLEAVAEGVEHADQRDALQRLGLRRMQGWLYSRAIDQAALQALLATTPAQGRA